MPITSYAQNFEDVMLARAFPGPQGFYVDVGANDPDIAEAHGKRVLQDMVVDLSRLYRTNDFARGFFNRISA